MNTGRLRRHRFVTIFSVAALVACGAYWLVEYRSREPKLSVADVELGSLEMGRSYEAEIVIGNAGSSPLTVDGITTDCACVAVYRRLDGTGKQAVKSLVLQPRERVAVGLDLRVDGLLGKSRTTNIYLRSNDPTNRERAVGLKYTPSARVYALPQTAAFGDVPVGRDATMTLELFSDGRVEGDVLGEMTTAPGAACTIRRADAKLALGPTHQVAANQVFLGTFELTLRASTKDGYFESPVTFYACNSELFSLQVSANFVGDVQFLPRELDLPRRSGEADVFSANVIVRSRSGPVTVTAKPMPVGVKVEFDDAATPSESKVMRVTYEHPDRATTTATHELPFSIQLGGRTIDRTFKLTLMASSRELPGSVQEASKP